MSTNSSDSDTIVGFVAIGITSLAYGSQYAPIKKLNLEDGLFVQWLRTTGVLFMGSVICCIRMFPPFQPWAALGGLIWSIANALIVPVMNLAGPMGIVITLSVSIITGWATPRFGLFWLKAEVPESELGNWLQIAGIVLTVGSAFIFMMVGPSPPRKVHVEGETLKAGFRSAMNIISPIHTSAVYGFSLPVKPTANDEQTLEQADLSHGKWYSWFWNNRRRLAGWCLSVGVACIGSQQFTPVTYLQQNSEDASSNGLDYFYSFAGGAFFGGTTFFLIYCIVMRNRPKVNATIALPGICYGILFAIGQASLFVANGKLSQAISFPICMRLPTFIMLIWDVFVFKLIWGRRNMIILAVGCAVSTVGVTLIAMADLVPAD